MNIFGNSGTDVTLLEAKTQYQSVPSTNTTNFQGTLTVNGVPISGPSSAYLPRDGSLPMTGDLDMDGNSINNQVQTSDIDMNSNDLLNVATITTGPNSVVIGQSITNGGSENVLIGPTVSCAGGNDCVAVGKGNTITGDACFLLGRDITAAENTVAMGHSITCSVPGACAIGLNLTNSQSDSYVIGVGNAGINNIRAPGTTKCDLGTSAVPFKDLYLDGEVKGAGALLTTAIQDQTYGVAPAGIRDSWSYGSVTGNFLHYESSADILHVTDINSGGMNYSNDGGSSFNSVVFDVAPTDAVIFGSDGAGLWVGLTYAVAESYTSVDGINFTQGAAPPGSITSSNIEWSASLGLFIAGCDDSATTAVMTSPDGVTWTAQTTPDIGVVSGYLSIASNDNVVFVACDSASNQGIYSADGIVWAASSIPPGNLSAACWSAEKSYFFCQLIGTGEGFRSTDAIDWTSLGSVGSVGAIHAIWVPDDGIERFYMPNIIDTNYGLLSTTDTSIPFEGIYLDGSGFDNTGYMQCVYLANYNRFVIGVNTTGVGLSTARPLDIKAIGDGIRVRGRAVNTGIYSMYTDTTVNNTVTETDISTNASSLGSLTLQASQPLGMTLDINLCGTASSAAGDNLTLRYYTNAGLLFSHVLTIPALSVNLPFTVKSEVTIRNGTLHVCSASDVNGTLAMLIDSTIVYNRTITNVWSVTAQWGANVNQLTVGQVRASSQFVNGA